MSEENTSELTDPRFGDLVICAEYFGIIRQIEGDLLTVALANGLEMMVDKCEVRGVTLPRSTAVSNFAEWIKPAHL